jgi:hypothetical protein
VSAASVCLLPSRDGHDRVLPAAVAVPAVDVDDFEASLHAGRRRRIGLGLLTGFAVLAAAFAAIHGWSHPENPALIDTHRQELADAITKARGQLESVTCGAIDGCWRRALAQRAAVTPSDVPCGYETDLQDRAGTSEQGRVTESPGSPSLPGRPNHGGT